MPDLAHTFQGQDLRFLNIVAQAWGVELDAPDARTAIAILIKGLADPDNIMEMMEALADSEQTVLSEIMHNQGKIPWSILTRQFGEVRSLGAAKRDKIRPDLNPISPLESLWYRGMIGRAFMKSRGEPQEYGFIPDEFLNHIQRTGQSAELNVGRPASPQEYASIQPVSDAILDDACTLLAALRSGLHLDRIDLQTPLIPLGSLLRAANLIDTDNLPEPEKVRLFLESPRSKALADLVFAWINSSRFNELRLLPDLDFEGEWSNDPAKTRLEVLEMVSHVPQGTWWNIQSFIQSIKGLNPDFQRPAGNYDTWFIRKKNSKEYLRGFSSWDDVEGALIRFFLCGPLHWLGMLDLAGKKGSSEPLAFRHSRWSEKLWEAAPPDGLKDEDDPVKYFSNGTIWIPRHASRSLRYQVSRFTEWLGIKDDGHTYRISADSMKRAKNQGLLPVHILKILKRGSAHPLPPPIIKFLERWDQFGSEAKIQKTILLHVARPEIIEVLYKSGASRYLGEILNPTTIQIRDNGLAAVRDVLAEHGYLAEVEL